MVATSRGKYLKIPIFAAFVPALVLIILYGDSQTSDLALAGGVLAWLMARFAPAITYWLMVVMWCSSVLLSIPAATAAYQANLQNAPWLFESAQNRIVIWGYTAEQIYRSPIGGIGLRGTRHYVPPGDSKKQSPSAQPLPMPQGLHAHNNFLQTWFELGAVGAGILLVFGLFLIARIRRLGAVERPYIYAAFATSVAVASTGWGMWQLWLLSAYGFVFIFSLLAIRYTRLRLYDGSSTESGIG